FWMYRLLFRNRVKRFLAKHPKLNAVEEAVSSQGFRLMALLRLGPFNYTVLNAVLGASEVRFRAFMFALIGAFPGNFATVYFGFVARHIAMKRAGTDNLSTAHEIIAIVGFVVTVVVCLFVGHVARHALKRAADELKVTEVVEEAAIPAGS
ncbi:MAG: VTT domain-containing protein, partial [Phycisphaerales bacterium]|nr:VTT domain-containing protein [Phycisphaerales bacterium]